MIFCQIIMRLSYVRHTYTIDTLIISKAFHLDTVVCLTGYEQRLLLPIEARAHLRPLVPLEY